MDTDYTGLAYGTVDGVEGWYSFHDGYNFHEGYLNKGKELVEYNGAWWYVSDEMKGRLLLYRNLPTMKPVAGMSETDRSIFHITEYLSTRYMTNPF